jgi:hypothetical protein
LAMSVMNVWVQNTQQDFSQIVAGLLEHFVDLWWDCPTKPYDLGKKYQFRRQLANEKRTDQALAVLENAMLQPRSNGWNKEAVLRELMDTFYHYTQDVYDFESGEMQALKTYGFEDTLRQFAEMARQFDPSVSIADIYQAGRNLWSMNFVQLLLGLPVEVTLSAFAYSMLYPYTDNYLDDPQIGEKGKHLFIHRFAQRLVGENLAPLNRREELIYALVGMVEGQFERRRYPRVYESLLAIHKAQTRSLVLLQGDVSPYALDVLGICFEKGGSSVLADGYLVAGDLTPAQQEKMFAYGALTQLVDDLEDAQIDRRSGLMTVFSQTLGKWRLDEITNRTMHFGTRVVEILAADAPSTVEPLITMFAKALPQVVIRAAAGHRRYYSHDYVLNMQAHYPLRFSVVESRQKRLYRKQQGLSELVEALIGKL